MWCGCGIGLCSVCCAFITGGLNLVGAGTPLMVIVLAKKMGADSAAIGLIFSIAAVGGIVSVPTK